MIHKPYFLELPSSPLHDLKYDLNLVKLRTTAFYVVWVHLLAYWTPPSSSFTVQLQVRFQIKALGIRKKQKRKKKQTRQNKRKQRENSVLNESVRQK